MDESKHKSNIVSEVKVLLCTNGALDSKISNQAGVLELLACHR